MPDTPAKTKPPTPEEIEKIIGETFSSLYYPQYLGDKEFVDRATRLALQALGRLPKASPPNKIRDCVSQEIACPEFSWRRYRNWPVADGHKLYLAPDRGVNGVRKESYFKKDTWLVLAELEKPDKERNLSRLKTGLFLIDRDIEIKTLLEGDEGAARMILETYDVRFTAMTGSMWKDFVGSAKSTLSPDGEELNQQKKTKPVKKRRPITEREKVIRELIRKGIEGKDYFIGLDDQVQKPWGRWIRKGCPGTHEEAYAKRWRHPIQDEKYRVGARMKEEKHA